MLKRDMFEVIGVIAILIIASISFFYLCKTFQEDDECSEVVIYHNENSVYNGYTPSEIAEYLAVVLDVTPLKSRELETHCCTTMYTYHYQNDASVRIFVDKNSGSLWSGIGKPITVFNKKQFGFNISADPMKTNDLIFGIWGEFLGNLEYNLESDNYMINNDLHSYWARKITIRQTLNDDIPLISTGVKALIDKDDHILSSLTIYDWSREKIERPVNINQEDAQEMICEELPEIAENKTDLNFSGYLYSSNEVFYKFNFDHQVDNESKNDLGGGHYITLENGTRVEESSERWIRYNLYVNIESREFNYNKVTITKYIGTPINSTLII